VSEQIGAEQALATRERLERLQVEIGKAIVGHRQVVEEVLVCLLCGGHALLEGVPGLGKTFLTRTLGAVLDLHTSRIQFTPDLMPSDILGTDVLVHDPAGGTHLSFRKGPIFAQIILADEINRATPKTQSALLEAMQEQRVTVGGKPYPMASPFMVLATQNPIEMEGTYPLPEAQLDRFFFKLQFDYPSAEEIAEIVDRTTGPALPALTKVLGVEEIAEMQAVVREVVVPDPVKRYAVRLVLATHPTSQVGSLAARYVRYGASPRGAQSLILAGKVFALLEGRFNVAFSDIRKAVRPGLRHRLILSFEGEAEGIATDRILEELVAGIAEE
jgi:MoxR-like ATPase